MGFHHLREEFSTSDQSPFILSPGDCFGLFLNVSLPWAAAFWLLPAEREHVPTASPGSAPPGALVCWVATPRVCQTLLTEALAELKHRQESSGTGLTVLNPLGN